MPVALYTNYTRLAERFQCFPELDESSCWGLTDRESRDIIKQIYINTLNQSPKGADDMDLRDSLNRYYYDTTVSDLRQLSRTGGGELSYNSIMYLDVISYQQDQGLCTVTTLAETLHISRSAATIKVNELEKLGLVKKTRSETDRRVIHLSLSDQAAASLGVYDRPFERAARLVEARFSPEEIETFCAILDTFSNEYTKDF